MYLTHEQIEALRRTSRSSGRSQSELIRAGIDVITGDAGSRRFRSLGTGAREPGTPPVREWSDDELYEHVMGQTWRDRHR